MKAPNVLDLKPIAVMPKDSDEIKQLKETINTLLRTIQEGYQLLHSDVKIMDFRELPPHYSISHSAWKWYENPVTGDLELWNRQNNTWSKTYWDIRGALTRPTPPVIT